MRSVAMLVLLAALCACGKDRPCAMYPAAPARPLVWRVSHPSVAGSLVIQATHQSTTGHDVSEVAWAELTRARLYVAEAIEPDRERDAHVNRRAMTHQRGQSLEDKIGGYAFNRLSYYLDVPHDQLYHLRPWVALVLLGQDAYPVTGPSMTEALYVRAVEHGKAIEALDTWDDQLAYLDAAITPEKVRGAIEDYDRLACSLRYRVAAFRAGDEHVFAKDAVDSPTALRNARWVVRLGDAIKRGEHGFAALGIGHLVGTQGVLEGLAASGFRVERM